MLSSNSLNLVANNFSMLQQHQKLRSSMMMRPQLASPGQCSSSSAAWTSFLKELRLRLLVVSQQPESLQRNSILPNDVENRRGRPFEHHESLTAFESFDSMKPNMSKTQFPLKTTSYQTCHGLQTLPFTVFAGGATADRLPRQANGAVDQKLCSRAPCGVSRT